MALNKPPHSTHIIVLHILFLTEFNLNSLQPIPTSKLFFDSMISLLLIY